MCFAFVLHLGGDGVEGSGEGLDSSSCILDLVLVLSQFSGCFGCLFCLSLFAISFVSLKFLI